MEWVIGDIHGCFYTLLKLLVTIEEQDPSPHYIFAGDYGDRGPFTNKVVELLVKMKGEGHHFVRGNHDDVLDWIFNGSCKGDMREMIWGEPNPQSVIGWWMQHGLGPALISYGIDTMRFAYTELASEWQTVIENLRDEIPKSHRQFFKDLPLSWENDTHFVVHAYVKPDIVLTRFGVDAIMNKKDRIMEALWGRFPKEVTAGRITPAWDKIGVFGHTPTFIAYDQSDAVKADKIRLIDTGACMGEKLTAYCCQSDQFVSVPTQQEDVFGRQD